MKRFSWAMGCLLLIAGCSSHKMSYVPTTTYDPNDYRSITDEDIRKAFEAQPQIRLPVKLAWYNMGTGGLMLSLIQPRPGVFGSYEIPKALIEGSRPYFSDNYLYYAAPRPIDLKAVRLLAARAQCDVVVLVGSRFEEQQDPNAWVFFNVLIVPVFVTPFLNVSYHYEAEALVFDVRNGYLYKHAKFVADDEKKYLTIYQLDSAAKAVEKKMKNKGKEYLTTEIYSLFKGPPTAANTQEMPTKQ